MYRPRTVTAAASAALAIGGLVLAAPTASPTVMPAHAPTTAAVPGPKQPIEHLGLSGGYFQKKSGNPGCYSGQGTFGASFPVPRGAMITGVTAYASDGLTTGNVLVTLNRHDLASGGTYRLGTAGTTGAPGETVIEIKLNPGVTLTAPSSTNVDVTVADGMCFKGAEVHFIRNPAPIVAPTSNPTALRPEPTRTAARPEPTMTAVAPDGAPTR